MAEFRSTKSDMDSQIVTICCLGPCLVRLWSPECVKTLSTNTLKCSNVCKLMCTPILNVYKLSDQIVILLFVCSERNSLAL